MESRTLPVVCRAIQHHLDRPAALEPDGLMTPAGRSLGTWSGRLDTWSGHLARTLSNIGPGQPVSVVTGVSSALRQDIWSGVRSRGPYPAGGCLRKGV